MHQRSEQGIAFVVNIKIYCCRDLLLSKLRGGTTLVVDRYAFSGAAFTAAKGLPGMDLDWAKVSKFLAAWWPLTGP